MPIQDKSEIRFVKKSIKDLKDSLTDEALNDGDALFPYSLLNLQENNLPVDLDSLQATLTCLHTLSNFHLNHTLKSALEKVGSPIEKYMLLAVAIKGFLHSDSLLIRLQQDFGVTLHPNNCEVIIEPQAQIDNYRVDFLINWIEKTYFYTVDDDISITEVQARAVIECDGHDFHEKTKAQASRDKKRDRDLQKQGLKVFRYSGSDIWRDVVGCAEEVILHLHEEIRRESRSLGHIALHTMYPDIYKIDGTRKT